MRQQIRVIGLCGYAGAGKTTAARLLVANHAYRRERFAGPLKDMLRALGLSEREVDGDLKETPCALLGGTTPRHAMRELGTRWGREAIHPDLWTRAWAHRVDGHISQGFPVVCDDVRFANEAAEIRARGGIIVKVTASRAERSSDHVSELIPFDWDIELANNGTVEELGFALDSCLMMQRAAA